MLIGQWVDKDSTISLCNEPLHRRSTASEEREREVTQRNYEICLDVCELCVVVSADWTLCRHLYVDVNTPCCSGNLHLSVESVSAKCCNLQLKSVCLLVGWHCICDITLRSLKEVDEPKGLRSKQSLFIIIWKAWKLSKLKCEVFTQQWNT